MTAFILILLGAILLYSLLQGNGANVVRGLLYGKY